MFSVGQRVCGVAGTAAEHMLGTVIGVVDAQGYSLYVVAPSWWRPMIGVELEGYFGYELLAY